MSKASPNSFFAQQLPLKNIPSNNPANEKLPQITA